jgi:hypothetical protein
MVEVLGTVHTSGRVLLQGRRWLVGPKSVIDQMAAPVQEIMDTTSEYPLTTNLPHSSLLHSLGTDHVNNAISNSFYCCMFIHCCRTMFTNQCLAMENEFIVKLFRYITLLLLYGCSFWVFYEMYCHFFLCEGTFPWHQWSSSQRAFQHHAGLIDKFFSFDDVHPFFLMC